MSKSTASSQASAPDTVAVEFTIQLTKPFGLALNGPLIAMVHPNTAAAAWNSSPANVKRQIFVGDQIISLSNSKNVMVPIKGWENHHIGKFVKENTGDVVFLRLRGRRRIRQPKGRQELLKSVRQGKPLRRSFVVPPNAKEHAAALASAAPPARPPNPSQPSSRSGVRDPAMAAALFSAKYKESERKVAQYESVRPTTPTAKSQSRPNNHGADDNENARRNQLAGQYKEEEQASRPANAHAAASVQNVKVPPIKSGVVENKAASVRAVTAVVQDRKAGGLSPSHAARRLNDSGLDRPVSPNPTVSSAPASAASKGNGATVVTIATISAQPAAGIQPRQQQPVALATGAVQVSAYAQAAYDFKATNPSEMDLHRRDLVYIFKIEDEWSLVARANGTTGWVPTSYLRPAPVIKAQAGVSPSPSPSPSPSLPPSSQPSSPSLSPSLPSLSPPLPSLSPSLPSLSPSLLPGLSPMGPAAGSSAAQPLNQLAL